MGTFASAAPYYAQFRPGYPDALYQHLRTQFGLNGSQHMLDLGCGPGTIALPLASHVAVVHAVDPEPAMLAEGIRLAHAQGAANIAWRAGDSTMLNRMGLPTIALCTMGKAIHWMDQRRVLADLDHVIAPAGGLAFVSGAALYERPTWLEVIERVGTTHLGPGYRQTYGPATHPADALDQYLSASAFSKFSTTTFEQPLEFTVDDLVGMQFSFSYTSPAVLGARKDAYEKDLRAALAEFEPSGVFREVRHIECTTAIRA